MQIIREYDTEHPFGVYVIHLADSDMRQIFYGYGETLVAGHAADDVKCVFLIKQGNAPVGKFFRHTDCFVKIEDAQGAYLYECPTGFADHKAELDWLILGGTMPMLLESKRVGHVRFAKEASD